MQLAPPDRLRELKRQRHLDADVDAEAIREWRAAPRKGRTMRSPTSAVSTRGPG